MAAKLNKINTELNYADTSVQLRYPRGGWLRQLAFLGHYLKTNLRISLEYRVAFISKVVGMLLNDLIWLFFWWTFFTRFPQASGYGVREALTLWLISSLGIGWSQAIFGNAIKIGNVVANGNLDYYLTVPKNVLFHLSISSMDVAAWGDLIFSLLAFLLLYQPEPGLILVVLAVSFFSGAVLISFVIIAQSLVFFLGNSEALANQIMFSLITFATYPGHLFRGIVKGILYTLIPAAFVCYIPVELIRQFDWRLFSLLALAAGMFVGLACSVFYVGLRRYESGNLLQMRN
jgi:ABC-2 type transport system permease protein